MNKIKEYFSFTKQKGKSVSEINPGSSEVALNVKDALFAIELVKNADTPILGGDVLSEYQGKLIYAYEYWGNQYIYLNWYCDKINNESQNEYCNRSYNIAKEAITAAKEVANKLEKECFIVLVI